MKGTQFLKRHSPTILSVIASAGVIASAVLAAKATPKAMAVLEEEQISKEEPLTPIETVKAVAPAYIPAASVCAMTILCILGANALNKRQQAAITSAYIFLEQSYKKYKGKVAEIFGKQADEDIQKAVIEDRKKEAALPEATDKRLFFEEHYGEMFERTMAEVLDAELRLNRKFATEGEASLNDFFEYLDLPRTDAGDQYGWSIDYICDFYNYSWIDFEHELVTLDDGLECYIINIKAGPIGEYLPL